jgi:hypothetical protein
MMFMSLICTISCLAGAPAPEVFPVVQEPRRSNTPAGQNDEAIQLEDVVVTGRRGAALVDPEIELGPDEIDAFGAYDISEVLTRIGDSLGFDGAPIIIVNGRRVVNPSDFLGFPPDALERVEALPQHAAAMYGGDPSRRVVNIVLQRRFASRDGRVTAARPTAGGQSSTALDVRQSAIQDNNTSQFGVQLGRDTALRASERPVYIEDHPGREGSTLRPAVDVAAANIALTRALGDWSSSINATVQVRNDRSGAVIDDQIVASRRETRNVALAGGVGGEVAGWTVRLGLDGAAAAVTQEGLAAGEFRTFSTAVNVTANRAVMELPAGRLLTNLSGRYARFTSESDRAGERTTRSLDSFDLGGNLSIPLMRSQATSLTLGANTRGAGDARGTGVSTGLSWSPLRKLRFNAQWSRSVDAPNEQQRLAPEFYGEPRVIFDFTTGGAVEVLPLFGGNPELRPQTMDQVLLTASAGPFTSWGLSTAMNLRSLNTTDMIGVLPAVFTPEVEAAFPDRFQRDAEGRLVAIDLRPLNLQGTQMRSLSSNLNFNIPVGRLATERRGRSVRVSLTHTWQLENLIRIQEGLPEMDRLAGDGGGAARHQVSVQADGRFGQWGFNAGARWRSSSRVRRDSGRDGTEDLQLAELTTVNLKLSYLLEMHAPPDDGAGSRRDAGVRMELEVENLFDARPEATLGDGRPASGYGRDDQDPLGRTVRITLSRRF